MLIRWSVPLLLTLTACAPSGGDHEQAQAGAQANRGVIRLALPSEPAPLETPPQQPEGAVWSPLGGGGVAFGLPGQPPLFEVSCTHTADGTARLRFTRRARAEEGAQALLAVEGNGHVARIAVNVTRAGDPGEWQGEINAAKETAGSIKGGEKMIATLPGGGALKLPPYPEAGKLLDACRASNRKPEAEASTPP